VYNPWTNLDGTLNEQTLGRLRAHVALSVIASPGISEERILDTFDVFRPAVAREILRLLQADGLVTLQYTQYSVPSWLSTASATSQDSSLVQIATERDYHEYIQRQYSHIRRGTLRPSHIVHKGVWPAEDIYMRL
jgi:DNA-binding FadR family transcriptional regulator